MGFLLNGVRGANECADWVELGFKQLVPCSHSAPRPTVTFGTSDELPALSRL
jgi:hypothetical protein